MSHFSVLVFGADHTKQLASFQENNMDDCPVKYMEFKDCTDEIKECYGELSKEEKLKYPTFDAYAKEDFDYCKKNSDGKWGYMDNLNSKWDWYKMGGRWAGYFKVKSADQLNFPGDIREGGGGRIGVPVVPSLIFFRWESFFVLTGGGGGVYWIKVLHRFLDKLTERRQYNANSTFILEDIRSSFCSCPGHAGEWNISHRPGGETREVAL